MNAAVTELAGEIRGARSVTDEASRPIGGEWYGKPQLLIHRYAGLAAARSRSGSACHRHAFTTGPPLRYPSPAGEGRTIPQSTFRRQPPLHKGGFKIGSAPNYRPAGRVVRCKAHRRPQSAGVGGTVGGLPRTAPRRAFPPFPPSPPRHMVCGLRRRRRKSSKNQQPRRAGQFSRLFPCPAAAGNLPFLILPPHRGGKTGTVQPARGAAVKPLSRNGDARRRSSCRALFGAGRV